MSAPASTETLLKAILDGFRTGAFTVGGGGGAPTSVGGQGTDATTIGVTTIGGIDPNLLLQAAKINQNGDLSTDLGGGLNASNDIVGAILSDGAPGQLRGNWVSGAAITVQLAPAKDVNNNDVGQLSVVGLPNILPVRGIELTVSNGSTKNIIGFALNFLIQVDGTIVTRTFTYPLVTSLITGAQASYYIPIPKWRGIWNKANILFTLANSTSLTTAAYVQVQARYIFTDIDEMPPELQWTFATIITNATPVTVVGPPATNSRICVQQITATNANLSTGTPVAALPHGGSNFWQEFCGAGGLGAQFGPHDIKNAYKAIPVSTGLDITATAAAGAGLYVSGYGYYLPI